MGGWSLTLLGLSGLLYAIACAAPEVIGAVTGQPVSVQRIWLSLGVGLAGATVLGLLLHRQRVRVRMERRKLMQRHSRLEQQVHRLMEQRLLALDDAQTARVKSVRGLAAGVAHEINTPLGALASTLDLVNRAVKQVTDHRCQGADPEPQRVGRAVRALEGVVPLAEEAVERIDRVVQQLARFSHLDGARQVPTDVRENLEMTLELLKAPISELAPQLRVVRQLQDVPLVRGDPDRLNLVFSNILLNAAEAVADSGAVEVACWAEPREVVVTMTDSGRGIPGQQLRQVIEPGMNDDGVSDLPGLGLPIARRIIRDHGGELTVTSEEGQGTRVEIRLPRQGVTSTETPKMGESQGQRATI